MKVTPVDLADVRQLRDSYRAGMNCQIVHDSLHARPGWTQEYAVLDGARPVGYGSVAIAGPWAGAPTVYEFFLQPDAGLDAFGAFDTLLQASGATHIETQTNDALTTVMLHTFAREVTSESIVFRHEALTSRAPDGARFRRATADDGLEVPHAQLPWHGIVEVDGQIAAKGGVLFHYNPPYGDVYMETTEAFRRRGFGAFLVQELARLCIDGGRVPAARCRTHNVASRRTLQRAGFVPCAHLLKGHVRGV